VALELTDNLKQQISSSQLTPTLVAKIDGYETIFANVSIKKYIRIGDPELYIGDDWFIGGFSLMENQSPYISFSQGTTTRIAQKLDVSRGQGSSVSQMTLAMLDYNFAMTEFVSPGKVLTDVIGRRVTVFLGAQESSWPEDYNVIFRGVIQDVEAATDTIYLNLSNTEEKKRISVLPKISEETTAPFDYKSVTFQEILFRNKVDVQNLITINYTGGGTAGSEVVTIGGGGYTINVQIQDGVSTAAQVKKRIENDAGANQLVDLKIVGDSSGVQNIGSTTLGSDSVVDIVDASNFVEPADILQTYAVIESELIKYTSKTGSQLLGCTRGENGSTPSFHDIGKSVQQVVRLTDNGINIALKLMLSKGPEYYVESLPASSFEYYSPSLAIDNAIFFNGVSLKVDHGVAPGDKVTVTLATNVGNNVVDSIIQEVGLVDDGSYIIVSDNLTFESITSAVVNFKSQFNVLPIGYGMIPAEVDVEQHIFIRNTFISTLTLDVFAKDITDGKSFLEKHVYMPMTCFSVPRKGRSSIVYTVGPLPNYEVVALDTTTVENPDGLRVKRSTNENFFNQVQFDYDYDPVTDKYTTRKNYPTEVDQSQIPVGPKPFLVQSQGLRTDEGAAGITQSAANRYLRRYQLGAEFIKGVKVLFSSGYQMEIGDVCAVDYADLKLADFSTGTRDGIIKLMEVTNKILDNKTGEVTLDLVNTTFGFGDRFGFISPSTELISGSTTTKLIMKKSWSTKAFERESKKWNGYVGQEVLVHSEDWSTSYTTILRGFDNNDPQGMSVDLLPTAPLAGWIVQCPLYPSSVDANELAFWKQRHAFFSPRVSVVAGVSSYRFTVSPTDVLKFFVGSAIRVHNYDFTVDSGDALVTEINGNDIIVGVSFGFFPTSNEVVDLIGFPDKQQSYRVV